MKTLNMPVELENSTKTQKSTVCVVRSLVTVDTNENEVKTELQVAGDEENVRKYAIDHFLSKPPIQF